MSTKKNSHKLWCLSQTDFDSLMDTFGGLPEEAVAISIIGTPGVLAGYLGEPETSHYFPGGTPGVLNLEFDDVTEDTVNHRGVTAYGITIEQASEVVKFLEEAVKTRKDIYVHCRAGRSRSQAIVRYVKSRWEGPWETNPWNPDDTPNYYVLGKLREAEEVNLNV